LNAPHELTTADLRAEVRHRERNLAVLRSSSDPAGRPASGGGIRRLELALEAYRSELRRRERYTNGR
jgi:hypothetical protein